jgi:hypothetical protein
VKWMIIVPNEDGSFSFYSSIWKIIVFCRMIFFLPSVRRHRALESFRLAFFAYCAARKPKQASLYKGRAGRRAPSYAAQKSV